MVKRFLIYVLIFILSDVGLIAQTIPSYTAEQLVQRVSDSDTTYIVNFWATWCVPCIKEMPEFEKLYNYYKGKPVKIILVSCNEPSVYPEAIQQFITKRNIQPEVVWLNDSDIAHFMPIIEPRWTGQIPSTIIFDNPHQQRYIYEGTIEVANIKQQIKL